MDKIECNKLGELIISIAEGNHAAIGEIYRKLGKVMYAVAGIYLGRYAEAEDVVHDSLLKIVQQADKFHENKNAYAWINTIIVNTAKDFLRKRKRKGNTESKNCYEFDDSTIIVREVFGLLNESEKLLLIYSYWYDMSLSEISKVLHMPKSTVKYRRDKLLEKLKIFYKK